MNITIRTANENDLQRILEIFAQGGVDKEESISVAKAQKILKQIEIYPNYKVYVAEEDGKIVGVFELLIMDNLAHGGKKSAIMAFPY